MFHVHGVQGRVFLGTLEQSRRHRVASGVARMRRVAPLVAEADQPLAPSEGDGTGHPLGLEAVQAYSQASVVAAAACSSSYTPKAVDAISGDFDPEAVRELQGRDLLVLVLVLFGDGEDPDFLETLPLRQVRWVITTSPQRESNWALLHALQAAHYGGQVVRAVRDAAHGRTLAEAGVARIFIPYNDAVDHAAARLARDIREQEMTP